MRRDGIEVALAATVGAVIALVIWAVMQADGTTQAVDTPGNDSSQVTSGEGTSSEVASDVSTTVTTQAGREQAALDPFLAAFRRSRTATYKATGRVQVAQAGTEDTSQILVSTVRRGGDVIEVAGTTLLVVLDGREQSCERAFGEELTCGEVLSATSVDVEVMALARLFGGTDPDYLLYDDEPGCWQMVATANPAPAQWGQSTTICFDEASGAIARQSTSSTQGTRTYLADTIEIEVTDEDLIPPS